MSVPTATARKELWRHPNPETTYLEHFRAFVNKRHNLNLQTYDEIHAYSTTRYAEFWEDVFHYSGIIHTGSYSKIVDVSAKMSSIPRWFDGVKLNLAENILHGAGKDAAKIAVTSIREGNTEARQVTWGELRILVARYAAALQAAGVKQGDRVAAIASNTLNTLLIFVAVASLGAIFTSTSTDMGTKGILDRLLQVKPRIVFMEDFAVYAGKETDLRQKVIDVAGALKDTTEFEKLVVCPRYIEVSDISKIPKSETLTSFLAKANPSRKQHFVQLPFNTPYLIAYSSGTTGQPKCIVHGIGGVILSQKKELLLHYNIGPASHQMIFTTTSWAMYNKSITSLLTGAHIVTYDGSPFHPSPTVLLRIAHEQHVTHLGISPRYLEELERRGVNPREIADLTSLQMVNCTGAALLPQQYAWFYDKAFHAHTQLANSAGGTDTACCFAVQVPTLPVYAGELQRPALAMSIEVFQPHDDEYEPVLGEPVDRGRAGELVVTRPFPSMPVMFWGEGGDERYQNAYFRKYSDVWTQGDFIKFNADTGGVEFLGRSDGVLNPSGVRFGSAEIYSVIERIASIADSICVGQRRPQDSDESVFLFVLMRPGHRFGPELVREIRAAIRRSLSARHVPKHIFECFEIPVTINGKKVELPVKQIISGKKIAVSSTLANPESLKYFEQFVNVEDLEQRAQKEGALLLDVKSKL